MNRLLALAAIAALASSPALATTTHVTKRAAVAESHAMVHNADRRNPNAANAAFANPYANESAWDVMIDAQKLDPDRD